MYIKVNLRMIKLKDMENIFIKMVVYTWGTGTMIRRRGWGWKFGVINQNIPENLIMEKKKV
jgi:hypothetical protein